MFTIITTPLVPLRAEAGDQHEMVSQLLFGQQIEIIETTENWYYVKYQIFGIQSYQGKNA